MKVSKSELIVILFSMLIATVSANAQDTVYIGTIANNATITYKGTVKSIPLSLISASKFTGVLQPTRVAIYNGATQVDDWVFNNYPFKINNVFVTNVDSFVPYVNRLNTASVRAIKLIQEIRIVSALPSNPDPTITYLIGAQTSVSITGLNGNLDQMYQISATIVSPGNQDAIIMRFNNISLSVYDWRTAQAGSTATANGDAQSFMSLGSNTGTNSISQLFLTIDAVTGKNRTGMGQNHRTGVNQTGVSSESLFGFNWRDTSTNLTSIQFAHPSVVNGYGVGTIIRVYALRQ